MQTKLALFLLMISTPVLARPVLHLDTATTSSAHLPVRSGGNELTASVSTMPGQPMLVRVVGTSPAEAELHGLPAATYQRRYFPATASLQQPLSDVVVTSGEPLVVNMPAAGTLELQQRSVITSVNNWQAY